MGPRHSHDRQHFPPNNIINMLGGAGFLWMGWTGFNGGSPLQASTITSLAVLNTHVCTATSLLVWLSLDLAVYLQSSVVGAVQGMITGLVCITPAAGNYSFSPLFQIFNSIFSYFQLLPIFRILVIITHTSKILHLQVITRVLFFH